jgi:GNAT superfamily N-acetyltransferase
MAHDSTVTFRTASVADSLAAARVNMRSAHDAMPAAHPPPDDVSIERRAAMFSRRFGAAFYRMVVAEAPGPGMVGFVDVGLPRNARWGCDAELYAMYVLGPYQRGGVGRRLFELACEAVRAQRLDSMYLIALQDNPCRAFYERLGGRTLAHLAAGAVAGQDAHVIYAWSGLCRPTAAPPPAAGPARPR